MILVMKLEYLINPIKSCCCKSRQYSATEMHIHITKVGPYWATRALSPLQSGTELESNINTTLSRVPELSHKPLQNQNEKKVKITASTLFLFKQVFSSNFFKVS